jgi:hypothetical protein
MKKSILSKILIILHDAPVIVGLISQRFINYYFEFLKVEASNIMRPPEPSPTTDPYLGVLLIIRSLCALISISKPAIRFITNELS